MWNVIWGPFTTASDLSSRRAAVNKQGMGKSGLERREGKRHTKSKYLNTQNSYRCL
jgi:hypothetical protein